MSSHLYNIRLELTGNPVAVNFHDILSCHGLSQLADGPTHDAGGTFDVVCTRNDLPSPTVDVIDIGLSDHRLLLWT